MMDAIYASKKFSAFEFDESDEVDEEKSPWIATKPRKKRHYFIDKYNLLKYIAGGMKSKGKKSRNKTIIVDEVDEAMKERVFRSDAALQSSSSNYNPKTFPEPRCPDPYISYHGGSYNTPRSLKAATDRKDSESTLRPCFADNESVFLLSDEDNDGSLTLSCNDLAGPSGDSTLEHEITSNEMELSVVVCPKYVTYGRKRYKKARLTFFCTSIKLDVLEEEGSMDHLAFEWKTMDLISIKSQWLDPFVTANICLHIKSEHPKGAASAQKSDILEVKFTVCDPYWTHTQELIKGLDAQYKEKWDVDLDSHESFEDFTYLEGGCDSVSISKRDFQLLQPEKFINDTIVDFYIEYLKKKIKPSDQRIHFFNSFFFRKLADFDENQLRLFDGKEAFQRVRKWTKKVNIFQKDYIFIPVNFRLHWSLIVICHPGEVVNFRDEELVKSHKVPCILHMDSIKGSHRGLESYIRCYLWEEWKERSNDAAEDVASKFMNLRFLYLEVPQQQNSYDCGLFMLHYMELFVKQAPVNFNPLNNFMSKDWFHPLEASLKRARIKRLIFELAKNNSQNVPSSVCNDKHSSEFDANEEEADVQFIHETCNSKGTCHGSNSDTDPIMVKPLRSEPGLNDEHTEIILFDSEVNRESGQTASLREFQSDCEKFLETEDNGGSLIAVNDQNHGRMVVYDPFNIVLSPIKESEETEDVLDKQLAITNEIGSSVTSIDKSLNLLQLKENENHPSEQVLDCSSSSSSSRNNGFEAFVVEDSDEGCSSSRNDVFENCVVVDSDSDDDQNTSFMRRKIRSKRGQGAVSSKAARKRRKRSLNSSSSSDIQVIFPCE